MWFVSRIHRKSDNSETEHVPSVNRKSEGSLWVAHARFLKFYSFLKPSHLLINCDAIRGSCDSSRQFLSNCEYVTPTANWFAHNARKMRVKYIHFVSNGIACCSAIHDFTCDCDKNSNGVHIQDVQNGDRLAYWGRRYRAKVSFSGTFDCRLCSFWYRMLAVFAEIIVIESMSLHGKWWYKIGWICVIRQYFNMLFIESNWPSVV